MLVKVDDLNRVANNVVVDKFLRSFAISLEIFLTHSDSKSKVRIELMSLSVKYNNNIRLIIVFYVEHYDRCMFIASAELPFRRRVAFDAPITCMNVIVFTCQAYQMEGCSTGSHSVARHNTNIRFERSKTKSVYSIVSQYSKKYETHSKYRSIGSTRRRQIPPYRYAFRFLRFVELTVLIYSISRLLLKMVWS